MKRAFRPKVLDMIVFLLGLAAIVSVSRLVVSDGSGSLQVEIRGASAEWIEPLSSDRTIEVAGPLGSTFVHISGNSVAIEKSPCANQTCVRMGSISSKDQWLACLPNKVFVAIRGRGEKEEPDAAAY